jgi:peptidoglycan DL-endopeptidase CwlO
MTRSRTRQASAIIIAAAATLAVLLTTVGSATANPSIRSKRAEAQAVLAQIQQSDVQLEKSIEAYNYANVQLQQIDADLNSNARHLVVARKSLGVAQQHIAERLKALYVNGDGGGAVEILLGAQSLDDLLNRLDMVQRVGNQDSKVLGDVKQFRKEVSLRRARLKDARVKQAQVVSERASHRRSIEAQLAERKRMLAGIQSEIKQLQAEEAARQAELRRQAEARLLAQQRQQASARTQAVELAANDFSPQVDGDSTETAIPTAPASQYGGVVGIAMQYLGTPYVWAGASPGGFDCSGLVAYVYAQVGVSLPHNAAAQYGYGTPVAYSDLQPGDLVFFSGLGHVGIYIGGGQFIHAPHTGDVVKISSLSEHGGYVGARRL